MPLDLVKVKEGFFDREAVKAKVDPAVRKMLSKFGAFVRRRAKSGLKYGKGTARPGAPPVVHRSGGFTRKKKSKGVVKQQPVSPLRELVLFAYDATKNSVVTGPTLGGPETGAPEALEYGGQAVTRRGGRTRPVTVRPHPYMGPAFETELGEVTQDLKTLLR